MARVPAKNACPWCGGGTDMVLDGGSRVCRGGVSLTCPGTAGFHACPANPRAIKAPDGALYVRAETGPLFCAVCNPIPIPALFN